jgi:hypothetical protein
MKYRNNIVFWFTGEEQKLAYKSVLPKSGVHNSLSYRLKYLSSTMTFNINYTVMNDHEHLPLLSA